MDKYIIGDAGLLLWKDGNVYICDSKDGAIVEMNRDTAISIARAILRHFEEEKK